MPKHISSYLDPSTCSGDNFIVWKKEICSIALETEDGEIFSDFKRLEFQDIWDETIILDWLEPVIWEGKAALVLHCRKLNSEEKRTVL